MKSFQWATMHGHNPFARSIKNKNAIPDHRWYLLNYVLLINNETIRRLMTTQEKEEEPVPYYIPPSSSLVIVSYASTAIVVHPPDPVDNLNLFLPGDCSICT